MSNYPPGVTGNEPQIAGPRWEGELERTCGAENVSLTVVGPGAAVSIEEISNLILQGRTDRARERLATLLSRVTTEVELEVCPFIDGEVEATESRSELFWSCPVCGKDHVEEPEGPDPDAAWDSRFDSL